MWSSHPALSLPLFSSIFHLVWCLGGGVDALPEMQLPRGVCHSVLVPLRGEPYLRDAGRPRRPLLGDHPLGSKFPHPHGAVNRPSEI